MPALKRYDRIFAIDTNTKPIGNIVVSVSYFAECRFSEDGDEHVFEYAVLGAYDFQNGPSPKCENFAWHLLIRAIQASPDYENGGQYAIITDYNTRAKPYFAEYLLPDNVTLIYAADKGRALTNQVIG